MQKIGIVNFLPKALLYVNLKSTTHRVQHSLLRFYVVVAVVAVVDAISAEVVVVVDAVVAVVVQRPTHRSNLFHLGREAFRRRPLRVSSFLSRRRREETQETNQTFCPG